VTGYRGGAPVARVIRSGFVEGWHRGSVVVLDPAGSVVAATGDVSGPLFPRSCNKPMQALGMLGAGLDLADPADLALVCASHSGEPFHVDRVRALLARGGFGEDDLACPPDLPLDEGARSAHLRAGGVAARVLMNCSGKHAGMLLTCRAAGWPVAGYTAGDHPLQRAVRAAVERACAEPVAAAGVDGCGAPVLAVSLAGLAAAFLRLVSAGPGTPARRVADAMRAHPLLVSGTGREDARLMTAVPGALSKVGAEGVHALAVPGVGAVALKIDDGAARARLPVLVRALGLLGVRGTELDELAASPLLGGGRVVGRVVAVAPE
jgi:L-asparaginase II